MPKYQPLATVAATALLVASYTQRARDEFQSEAHPSQSKGGAYEAATAEPPQSVAALLPYGEDEYSEPAARRIGQAFARLGMAPDWVDDTRFARRPQV